MRILLVIDHLGNGGAQRQIVNLGCALHRRGHEVELFCYYPASDLRQDIDTAGLQVWLAEKRHRYSPLVPFRLRERLRLGAYHVALSYLDTPNLYLELASTGLQRTRIVVSKRAEYPAGPLPFSIRVKESFHRLADHVVVNSMRQMARMQEAFPWLASRISVISNGVAESFFRVARPVREPGSLRLLALATLVPLKNADTLIEALALCREKCHVHVSVSWAGRHPDSRYRASLDERIRMYGLTDNWTWLGERRDVIELMNSHDALVHPSYTEGLPNAVCEALAAGMPVLASDAGDHGRLVAAGHAGFIFSARSPEQIAAAIQKLSALPADEFTRLSDNARQVAQENFSLSAFASAYEGLFSGLTGRSK